MNVLFWIPEHPVLVPIRFAHPQDISRGLQLEQVNGFVGRIWNHDENIDDGLGCETGDGRRPNVLDPEGGAAKATRDDVGVLAILLWPTLVVVDDLNFPSLGSAD